MVLTSVTDASLWWLSTPPSWHIDAVGGASTPSLEHHHRHCWAAHEWAERGCAAGRTCDRRALPRLRGRDVGPDPEGGRHPHPGQPRRPQGGGRARGDRGGGGPAPVPPPVLAGVQPN